MSNVITLSAFFQYNDLKKKKRIVENDKAKILETIIELDQKKNEALNVAWQKVKQPPMTHSFFTIANSKTKKKIMKTHDASGSVKCVWLQVNKDFGSIFSTLLPGANARLAPPEGRGVLDGLEFKVALGNTWKENLTELSGGQRSDFANSC